MFRVSGTSGFIAVSGTCPSAINKSRGARTVEKTLLATANLNGQKLTKISMFPSTGRSKFEFDLGGLFETWPVGDDRTTKQWIIYGPDAVFTYRADGQYSLQLADTPPEMTRWQPLT